MNFYHPKGSYNVRPDWRHDPDCRPLYIIEDLDCFGTCTYVHTEYETELDANADAAEWAVDMAKEAEEDARHYLETFGEDTPALYDFHLNNP